MVDPSTGIEMTELFERHVQEHAVWTTNTTDGGYVFNMQALEPIRQPDMLLVPPELQANAQTMLAADRQEMQRNPLVFAGEWRHQSYGASIRIAENDDGIIQATPKRPNKK